MNSLKFVCSWKSTEINYSVKVCALYIEYFNIHAVNDRLVGYNWKAVFLMVQD